jgi:hypothetical protein
MASLRCVVDVMIPLVRCWRVALDQIRAQPLALLRYFCAVDRRHRSALKIWEIDLDQSNRIAFRVAYKSKDSLLTKTEERHRKRREES